VREEAASIKLQAASRKNTDLNDFFLITCFDACLYLSKKRHEKFQAAQNLAKGIGNCHPDI
jgi:hypothetical protein